MASIVDRSAVFVEAMIARWVSALETNINN
jgi:hypothetical protein